MAINPFSAGSSNIAGTSAMNKQSPPVDSSNPQTTSLQASEDSFTPSSAKEAELKKLENNGTECIADRNRASAMSGKAAE